MTETAAASSDKPKMTRDEVRTALIVLVGLVLSLLLNAFVLEPFMRGFLE